MAATTERLISADDHVDISHDAVKAHLASKHHANYDAGVMEFFKGMGSMMSAEANRRWREQNNIEVDAGAGAVPGQRAHAAFGRAGHTDAAERLKDMDVDGVYASSSYCEVSAFR